MPRLGQFKDLTGMRVGKLIILSVDRTEFNGVQRVRYWKCQCDCGGSIVIRGSHLTERSKAYITRSCGCERFKYQRSKEWKEKSRKEDTAFRICLSKYIQNAKNKGREWGLTEEQFKTLTSSPCYYTGKLPSTVSIAKSGEVYLYNGIDRLDSSKGYTIENCVPCCEEINRMKMDLPMDIFIKLCHMVAERF